jgi:hypothetical protein
MNLPKNGEVLTSCGWKQYEGPFLTKKNARLVEVAFNDGNTVKCTPDHLFLTDKGWKYARDLRKDSLIQSTLTLSHFISRVVSTVCGPMRDILQKAEAGFIGTFGRQHLEEFQMDATFITGIQTQRTIAFQTLSALIHQSICQKHGKNTKVTSTITSQTPQEIWLLSGTDQKLVACGTVEWQKKQKAGQNGKEVKSRVYGAVSLMSALIEKMVSVKNFVIRIARPLTIASVKELNETADVWDITVPNVGNFSLANGAIVHNSDAWRYLSLSWKHPKTKQPSTSTSEGLLKNSIGQHTFGDVKKQLFTKKRRERHQRLH